MGNSSSKAFETRRKANARSIEAFEGYACAGTSSSIYRTVYEGRSSAPTIFTIGYERRDADDLIASLVDAGVDTLVDVRQRPFSRKPDFRQRFLQAKCENAGIQYESWTRLGSTEAQREIHARGETALFMSRFKDFASRRRADELAALAKLSRKKTIALICYERDHDDCHRCVVAELLASRMNATVVAIQ